MDGQNDDSISRSVFSWLAEAIIRGDFAPGETLSEPKIARMLNISRGPLREAIRRLEERQLVTHRPNQGARVATPSLQDLIELFVLREAVEGVAAREVVRTITDAEIDELRRMLDQHTAILEGPNAEHYWREALNSDFHFFIVRATRNKMLFKLICEEQYPLLRFYRMQHSDVNERAYRSLVEHRRIVDAIADRDAELAELLMRRHIAGSRVSLEARIMMKAAGTQPSASVSANG